MNYIDIKNYGAADVLQLQQMPVPKPKADEIVIKVYAAGVNRPDIIQRQGLYPPPRDASSILGLEVAGEVVACGEAVEHWSVGNKVCALVNGGGYAEYAVAPEAQCLAIPSGLSFIEAAALPETFFTVWHNLWQRAKLKPGETLLVHGGSSGIGTSAIQMAAARGITVYVTAGSDEKCAACETLGATRAVNYRQQDFVAAIKFLTDGRGVDVILDMVGGDYIQKNISAAAPEGRIVNIAYLNGSQALIDFMPLMLKRLTLTGSTLRSQSPGVKKIIAQELRTEIWPLIEAGKIKPLIAATYPLKEVSAAHQLMESNAHIGKIVLTLDHTGETQVS